MTVTVTAGALVALLAPPSRSPATSTTTPVLAGVRIEAGNGVVTARHQPVRLRARPEEASGVLREPVIVHRDAAAGCARPCRPR